MSAASSFLRCSSSCSGSGGRRDGCSGTSASTKSFGSGSASESARRAVLRSSSAASIARRSKACFSVAARLSAARWLSSRASRASSRPSGARRPALELARAVLDPGLAFQQAPLAVGELTVCVAQLLLAEVEGFQPALDLGLPALELAAESLLVLGGPDALDLDLRR